MLKIFSADSQYHFVPQLALTIIAVALSAGGAVLVTRFTGPLPISINQTSTEKNSSFNVEGSASLEAIPDQAEVTLGITLAGTDIASTQDKVNVTIKTITDQLKKQGVNSENITTQNYQVYPEYNYELEPATVNGYRVSTNLHVEIDDLSKVSEVIDTATANGANQVGGIQFTLSDELEKTLTKQARMEAIENAKENARELSSLAGMRLGRIINITESRGGGVQPPIAFARSEMMAMDAGGGIAPTPIEPGSSTFEYYVTLSYETN